MRTATHDKTSRLLGVWGKRATGKARLALSRLEGYASKRGSRGQHLVPGTGLA